MFEFPQMVTADDKYDLIIDFRKLLMEGFDEWFVSLDESYDCRVDKMLRMIANQVVEKRKKYDTDCWGIVDLNLCKKYFWNFHAAIGYPTEFPFESIIEGVGMFVEKFSYYLPEGMCFKINTMESFGFYIEHDISDDTIMVDSSTGFVDISIRLDAIHIPSMKNWCLVELPYSFRMALWLLINLTMINCVKIHEKFDKWCAVQYRNMDGLEFEHKIRGACHHELIQLINSYTKLQIQRYGFDHMSWNIVF